jgi:hypothetical protein
MRLSSVLLLLVLALGPAPALAYLDPGVGSILIQSIIAGVVAALVFFRNLKYYVLNLFSKRKPKTSDTRAESDNPETE